MSVFRVLKYPHVLLRKKSTPVEKFTPGLNTFVESMLETMTAFEGIGLAAPQIGIQKRICVCDVGPSQKDKTSPLFSNILYTVDNKETQPLFPLALINPAITKTEEEFIFTSDGCLSLPGVEQSNTRRFRKVTVEAFLPNGIEVRIETDGLLAVCLQHEIDHLDGILYIDRLIETPDSEAEVRAQIADAEESREYRKRLKKFKQIEARNLALDFV